MFCFLIPLFIYYLDCCFLRKLRCHAPNFGPTRLDDPNRFPGRETKYWDSLPEFFFFF